MSVICSNCGGEFNENEAKCPFCGMIYEPGAEKAYMGKLENIRENLDRVDDIVVTNIKSDMKRFLKVFGITLAAFLVFALLIHYSRIKTTEKNKAEALREVTLELERIREFGEASAEWDSLYIAGDYDAFYKSVSEKREQYRDVICNWRYYTFYASYDYYAQAVAMNEAVLENGGRYSWYELSRSMYNMFNMYLNVYNDQNSKLSAGQKETLGAFYDGLREDFLSIYNLSETDYENFLNELTGELPTYIGYNACEDLAKERLGE